MYYRELDINVLKAAERRVLEAFNRHKLICFGFSGGKDSICLASVIVNTMQRYNIDFSRLIVYFFDEEAIYPDVEEITKQWRSNFLALGAKFYWFAMPYKHFNCCNKLENDETFICWDPAKQDRWVRPKPKFAISMHKDLKYGMSYQTFSAKVFKNIPHFVGLRISESVQRRNAVATSANNKASKKTEKFIYPIYDWYDDDVWLYIQRMNLDYPKTYIYLWKTGVAKNKLRISQFFSIDTIKTLPKMLEFYPDLYEAIQRREPNIDLVMLYGETDMFRSSRQDKAFDNEKNYKQIFIEEFKKARQHPDDYPGYRQIRIQYSKCNELTPDKVYKTMYQVLIAGDPKGSTIRTISMQLKNSMAGDEIVNMKVKKIRGKFNGKREDKE